jgi:Zn-dependent protease/CBS domain-containing protein
MKSSIRFGRLFGIEIGAHYSWLIILVLVTLSLAAHFDETQSGWSSGARWGAALVTAVLFFASVVAHELAHSLLAIRYGIPVRGITLFLFGGVSQIESDAKRPSDEFWIAIVGPLSSVAVAVLFAGVAALAGGETFTGAVARWLAGINLALAIFNLLPAFPLDGGRVLRGLIWWKTGDQRRATRVAAGAGRILAMLMILGGIWMFFRPGGGFGGLWIAFIGWFLLDAARAGEAQVEIQHALRGVTAADIMTDDWPQVAPDLPLDRFVSEHLLRTGRRCALVTEDGRVLGLVSASDLKAVDRERWPRMTVSEAMRPVESLRWVEPTTSADRVLEIMGREEVNQLPVMSGGRLQGIVSREHVIRLLSARTEFAA